MKRILIKYHGQKMLMTVDLQVLFREIFSEFGQNVCIEFQEMDAQEKGLNSKKIGMITGVNVPIWILELSENGIATRRADLESKIIQLGHK